MLLMCTGSEGTTTSSSTEIFSLSVIVAYVSDRVGPFLVSSLAPKRLLLFSLYAFVCVCVCVCGGATASVRKPGSAPLVVVVVAVV